MAQIVGQQCGKCGEGIESILDGDFCARCGLPMHHYCKNPDYEPNTRTHCSACGGNPSRRLILVEVPPEPGDPAQVSRRPSPTAEFQRLLLALTPRVYMTPLLAGLNILVFVIMAVAGVNIINPTIDDLLRFGSNFGPKTTGGEWGRLLSCTFVHVGLVHLVMNMLVLITGGPLVERMLGNVGFLIMYLVSGLAGSLTSLFWHPLTVSAGASGAIFGIYGALLGILLRQQGTVPAEAMTRLRNSGLGFLLMNLVYGLSQPHIDFAAHLGGLAGGFVCGVIMGQAFTPETRSRRPLRNFAALVFGVAIVAGGVFGASAWYKDLAAAPRELDTFFEIEKESFKAYNAAVEKSQRQQITDSAFADLIERDLLPKWRASRERLTALQKLPPEELSYVGKILEYMRLRQESWEMLARGLRDDDPDKRQRANELLKLADAAAQQIGKDQ